MAWVCKENCGKFEKNKSTLWICWIMEGNQSRDKFTVNIFRVGCPLMDNGPWSTTHSLLD
ncbi:hypothetical protein SK128_016265 [Halocaridina rubra]|uniref:Uncharacterized protein n=1 Tax=Halocaridina rubra TaxID=373956 RepID=A0AAN9FW15_HALRR